MRSYSEYIDCHVHITESGRWFNTNYDSSVVGLLREMDKAEIGKAIVLPIKGYTSNEYVRDVVDQYSDRLIGFVSEAGDGVAVGLDAWVALRLPVIHPHLVAAGPLRHDSDKWRLGGRCADPFCQRGREPAEIIGRDRFGAVVMHRVVGQHGKRPAVSRLDG